MNFKKVNLQEDIIYGPVNSRRLGKSLGLNILPLNYKHCSFRCIYCQYGSNSELREDINFSKPKEIKKALESALNFKPDTQFITFSGNGESTLHPKFNEIAEIVKLVRDKIKPKIKIALLSNATNLTDKNIKAINRFIDMPIMKLDSGNEEKFIQINRPIINVSFKEIVSKLKKIEKLFIQTLFFKGTITNADKNSVQDWLNILKELNPIEVQIYTLSRSFDFHGIEKLTEEEIRNIETIGKNKKINVKAY